MVNRTKEFLSLVHTYKNLVTNTQNARLVDVLDSDVLHANKNYVAKSNFGINTLFEEVQLMKWENALSSKWIELGKIPACTVAMTKDEFITTFINTMTDYLESTWEKDRFHIVTHSGGWDSRILSAIIRDIYDRLGDSFIGDIFFACFGYECKHLKKIMTVEGWDSDQYGVFPYDEAFFTHQLNFKKAWSYLNGPNSYPINWRSWLADKLNVKPEDADFYTAGYFNEVFRALPGNRINQLHQFVNKYYYAFSSRTNAAYPNTNLVQAIINPKTLEHVIKSKTALPTTIRFDVLRTLNSELYKIPRLSNPANYPLIPQKNMLQAKKDYFNSFYGREINSVVKVEPRLAHSSWWSYWSTASLVEHLIEGGYEITWR